MPAMAPLVFFGTPEFAVPTLEALSAADRMPALVVSQPSRPAGRGHQPQLPPVARWARERGLPLLQPERVRSPEFLAELAALRPAIAVVVAFGQIFPRELLRLPAHGCLNLHASLLPRHRGAAPIQAAIAAGDERTGVTVMRMEEGLDSGPILLQAATPIGGDETAGELSARLAALGARLMVEVLDGLERGDLAESPQDATRATLAPRLRRESARAVWSLGAAELANQLRAHTPWPGMTAVLRGAPVKLLRALPLPAPPSPPATSPSEPGTYLGLEPQGIAVACGAGTALAVTELQRPGRKAQRAADFVNGERLRPGERFS
ncbi:MAG TPA: methionyl-tRNA formyltransferase [Thermoanaerobaculia bacterium]|nr:methionyl-tRNA formyltransferase [Thermoanaerobaculia bacterium]